VGFAAPGRPHQPSHAVGTGLSIAVHAAIVSLILLATLNAPAPDSTPRVPVALMQPNFLRRGAAGRIGGSGMESAGERPRPSDTPPAPRAISPVDPPREVVLADVSVPTVAIDTPQVLPGSATAIETIGAGLGPGSRAGRGSGSDGDGTDAGPGRHGGALDDGAGPGSGVTEPVLVHEVRPAYTVEAMRAKVQGVVELDVTVLPDGSVDPARVRVARSLDAVFGLDAQAVAAVKQWRFRPGRRNHRPVPVRVRVELTFTLR
jgi:protein TonB